MDRGAWRATFHGAAKRQTRLSTHSHTHCANETNIMLYAKYTKTVCPLGPHFSGAHFPAQPFSLSLHGVCAHPQPHNLSYNHHDGHTAS